jgi:tetratricopeptide (TPR) repeat protein
MKRAFILTLALIAVAGIVAAQTAPATQPSPTPAPAQTAPAQAAPAATPKPITPSQAAPAPAPSAPGRSQPQAQTQAEFKAYQAASAKTAPADVEAAANDFAAQFPASELRTLLYLRAMREYQNANNADKTVDMGRKALSADPNNPEALVTVATVLSERTRETDLDRDERLAEAIRDAQKALQTVDTDLVVPPNVPPDRVQAAKNSLRSMAYAALGTVEMTKKNYPQAETNLKQAVQMEGSQPDPVSWLRLAVVLDQEKKYEEALQAANKAVEYSANMPQANNLAKMERDRLQKLVGAATAPGSTPAATPAPKPATPTLPSTPPK